MNGNGKANTLFPKYLQYIFVNYNICCGHRSVEGTCSDSKRSVVKLIHHWYTKNLELQTCWVIIYLGQGRVN